MHWRRLDRSQRQMSSSTWMYYHRNDSILYLHTPSVLVTQELSLYLSISLYLSNLHISMSAFLHLSPSVCLKSIHLSLCLSLSFSSLMLILPVARSLLNVCVFFTYIHVCLSSFVSFSMSSLYLSSCFSPVLISFADSFSGPFPIKHDCHSSFPAELNTEHEGGGPLILLRVWPEV